MTDSRGCEIHDIYSSDDDNEVLLMRGTSSMEVEEAPTEMTHDEQVEFCDKINESEQHDFFFTFKHDGEMEDARNKEFVLAIKDRYDDATRNITHMTIGMKNPGKKHKHTRLSMAVKITSKRAVHAGKLLIEILGVLPTFRGQVEFDERYTKNYLHKARNIVSPKDPIHFDGDAYVYGERKDDLPGLYDLLRRIQNSSKGSKSYRNIQVKYTEDMVDSAIAANRSWARLMKDPLNQKLWERNALIIRRCFDDFSRDSTCTRCFSSDTIDEIKTAVYDESEDLKMDVEVGGKLEHHGIMGCTQDKYDAMVAGAYEARKKKAAGIEESRQQWARHRAMMDGMPNVCKIRKIKKKKVHVVSIEEVDAYNAKMDRARIPGTNKFSRHGLAYLD